MDFLLWLMGRALNLLTGAFRSVAPPMIADAIPDTRPELNFLRRFLRGENPGGSFATHHGVYYCPASSYNNNPERAVLSNGGYYLLYRLPGETPTYILNLDKPIAPLPIEQWRAKASVAARDVGVEILPVAYTAYERVRVDGYAPRLIHRDGFEAVFSVADKYYLSGYDDQEDPPLYFLCRLPYAVSTVAEAREALRPASVRTAERSGAAVLRQGDLFFIDTGLDDIDVKIATDRVHVDGEAKQRVLYGTAHYADGVAHLRSATMLAKGTVRHNPRLIGQYRSGDHHDLELPGGWWLVARNTVPAQVVKDEAEEQLAPSDWFSAIFGDAPPWMRELAHSMFPNQMSASAGDESGEEG